LKKNVLGAIAVTSLLVGVSMLLRYLSVDSAGSITTATNVVADSVAPMQDIRPPRRLPEFHFVDELDNRLTLADFTGKVLLVNIWATWCPPCREEMPSLDRLQSQLGSDKFAVVTISTDLNGNSLVKRFFKNAGIIHLEPYFDHKGETEDALKLPGLPTTFLINEKGLALGVRVGPLEWDSEEVITMLRAKIYPLLTPED
jgi:thiol-disulfide isomerase/thioredoxin